MKLKDIKHLVPIDRESIELTEDYLKTRSGLRDLLKRYSPSTPVLEAIEDYKYREWQVNNI